MKNIYTYLNPIKHLGDKKYSIFFPFYTTLLTIVLVELYVYNVVKDPSAVGLFAIFIFVALILYFSFREGIRGGVITSLLTIAYYFYIINSRNYQGQQYVSGIQTTIILGFLYLLTSGIIGWLKQTIDKLIQLERAARESVELEKARLTVTIEQMPAGVIIAENPSKKLILVNDQVRKILNMSNAKDKINDFEGWNGYHSDGKKYKASEWPLMRSLTRGETITSEEIELRKSDGSKRTLLTSAVPIIDSRGRVKSAVSVFSDITARKEQEKQKDDFVSMVSHELKTPITSMKGYIEVLKRLAKKKQFEDIEKYIDKVNDQSSKLKDLVLDLLDVSRIHTGKLNFNVDTFFLDEIVEETVEGIQATTTHKILVDKKDHFKVRGDKFRIYQVIVNLLTNAIKYSPSSDKVIVSVCKNGKKGVVSVKDFGIGIRNEDKEKIFDRLYQANDPEGKTFPGLGMGLYISKEIVRRHKGEIIVGSEKGKGSTFSFTLPLDTSEK